MDSYDVATLIRGLSPLKEPTERIPRINFVITEGQDEGNYIAVVHEHHGTFYLDAVYREPKINNRARFDIALPGRLAKLEYHSQYFLTAMH